MGASYKNQHHTVGEEKSCVRDIKSGSFPLENKSFSRVAANDGAAMTEVKVRSEVSLMVHACMHASAVTGVVWTEEG